MLGASPAIAFLLLISSNAFAFKAKKIPSNIVDLRAIHVTSASDNNNPANYCNFRSTKSLFSTVFIISSLFLNSAPSLLNAVHAETLTASELIKSDIAPKVEKLNDILFVLKALDELITKQDYVTFRSLLRQDPAVTLRVTARKLKLLLPSKAQQATFEKAYSKMIDSLDYMDSINLKRTQGSYDDKTLHNAWVEVIENYHDMMKTINY
mmetsp:Transcript_5592/g.5782  ORF Transcript_5592/g.5782 Transcript_5592/m.5782 type:complete len:209 (+) Transcript_5592:169-795(+)